MARWTRWRKIADKKHFYTESFDYEGPACYELGIGGPRGGNMRIVYVGETKNEKARILTYARYGSHLSDIIDDALRRGWTLYYRGQAKSSKKAAKELQDSLLKKFNYDWNLQLNVDDDD